MNTFQLENLANSCPEIGPIFLGVFPSDQLPTTVPRPSSLIANLDSSQQDGSHWVSLYFPKRGLAEYMDSYGMAASPPFHQLLGPMYRTNTIFIQSPFTAVCGQYCLYFLFQRNRSPSMDTVLAVFDSDNHLYNDVLVNRFIEEHFSINLNLFDLDWQFHQICRSFAE